MGVSRNQLPRHGSTRLHVNSIETSVRYLLEFLGDDIHGLDIGVSDKQLFSTCEKRLGYLPVDMSVSSILILEGIEYAERCGRDLECEPRCCPCFCLDKRAGRPQELFHLRLFAGAGPATLLGARSRLFYLASIA
jgi:hypothetical protein